MLLTCSAWTTVTLLFITILSDWPEQNSRVTDSKYPYERARKVPDDFVLRREK